MKRLLLWSLWLTSINCVSTDTQKPFVVVIPSYNNEQWCEKNLISVFDQEYDNYRVIYIDDCSTDQTKDRVEKIIKRYDIHDKVTFITNAQRCGATYNFYHAINRCDDHEIVLVLDGDDWFAHPHVMTYLNEIYQDQNVWLTYGQYQEFPSNQRGFCEDFPHWVVQQNLFRKYQNLPISHLRTFYAGLFKRIKKEDLCDDDGNFFSMTCDKATMAPMIEMAGERYRFINETLYIYNNTNQISDHRVNHKLQLNLMHKILARPAYKRLDNLFN
jgi:glycosyltransferase involved in cell wall biosynthesis